MKKSVEEQALTGVYSTEKVPVPIEGIKENDRFWAAEKTVSLGIT